MNKVRLYYIYDAASDFYMYFCEAPTDAVAMRQFVYSCKNDFKAVSEDLTLFALAERENDQITPIHEMLLKFKDYKEN